MANLRENNYNKIPSNPLLILCLAFTLILILLDSSFPAPRNEILGPLIKFAYWVSAFFIMYILAYKNIPDLINKLPLVSQDNYYVLLFVAVILLCLVLALNIKTIGGLPSSPYASFLSSFPVFCMVMIFGEINTGTCTKALLLIVLSLGIVEVTDRLFISILHISLSHEKIADFLNSDTSTHLSFVILGVTIMANILSILFAQQNHSADGENVGGAIRGE